MDLREKRKQLPEWNLHGSTFTVSEMPQDAHVEGPGVPMYDPSLGRIVYVPVDWPERKR